MQAIRVVLKDKDLFLPVVLYAATTSQEQVEVLMTCLDIGFNRQIPYYLTLVELNEKVIWPEDNKPAEEILNK